MLSAKIYQYDLISWKLYLLSLLWNKENVILTNANKHSETRGFPKVDINQC